MRTTTCRVVAANRFSVRWATERAVVAVPLVLGTLLVAGCIAGTDQQTLTAGENPGQVARLMSHLTSEAIATGQLCDRGGNGSECLVSGVRLAERLPSNCSATLIATGNSRRPQYGLVTAAHCLIGNQDQLLDRYPRAGKAYEHPDVVDSGTIWLPDCGDADSSCRGAPQTEEGRFEAPIWAETYVGTKREAKRVAFVPNAVRFLKGRDIALLTRIPRGDDLSRGFYSWNGRQWTEESGYEAIIEHGKRVELEAIVNREHTDLDYDDNRYIYWCGFGHSGNVTAAYDDSTRGDAPCSGWLSPKKFQFNSESGNAFVANRQQWADSGSSGGGVLMVSEPGTPPTKSTTATLVGVLVERFDSCGSGEINFDDCEALPHCAPSPQAMPANTQLALNLQQNAPEAFAEFLSFRDPDKQLIRDQLDELLYFGNLATDGTIDDPTTDESGALVAAFALVNFYQACTTCSWGTAVDELMASAVGNTNPTIADARDLLLQTRLALLDLSDDERNLLAVAYTEFAGGLWTCAPKPDYVASAEIINGIAPFSPRDVEMLQAGLGLGETQVAPVANVLTKTPASFSVLLCLETEIGGITGAVCSAPSDAQGLADPISDACRTEVEEALTTNGVRGDIRIPFMLTAQLGHSVSSPYQQHFGLGAVATGACNDVLMPEAWNASTPQMALTDFVAMVAQGQAYAPDDNLTPHDLANETARRIQFDQVGRLTITGRAIEQCVRDGAGAVGFGVSTCGMVTSRGIYGGLEPTAEGDEPLGSMVGELDYLEGRACELPNDDGNLPSGGVTGEATEFLHPITKEPAVALQGQSLCFNRCGRDGSCGNGDDNSPLIEVQWVPTTMAKILWHAMQQMESQPEGSAALRMLKAAYRLDGPLDATLGRLAEQCDSTEVSQSLMGSCIRGVVASFAELAASADWFGAPIFEDWVNVGTDLRYQSDDGLQKLKEQWLQKARHYPVPSDFQRGTPDPLEAFLAPSEQKNPAPWFKVAFLAKTFSGNKAASVATNHAKMGTMNLWAAGLLVDALNHGGEQLEAELSAYMLGRYLDALYLHGDKRFAILAFGAGNMTFLAPDATTVVAHAEAALDMWGGAPASKLPFDGNPWAPISPLQADGEHARGRFSGHLFDLDYDNGAQSAAQAWAGDVSKELIAEIIFTSGMGSAIWGAGAGTGIDVSADFGSDVWGSPLGSGIWFSSAGAGIWGTMVGDGIWGDAIGSSIWGGNLGDGIWGDMLGGSIWGVGAGSGIWGSFLGAGIWGSNLGTSIWGGHVGTGIWASHVGAGIWGNPLGSGVWGAPASSGIWGGALGSSIWATGLGTDIWGSSAGSGIWADHLGGGIWGNSVGSGVWASHLGYGIWGSSLGSGVWGQGAASGIWGAAVGNGIYGTMLGGGIWGQGLGSGIWGAAGGSGIWGSGPGSGIWGAGLGGGISDGHGSAGSRGDGI